MHNALHPQPTGFEFPWQFSNDNNIIHTHMVMTIQWTASTWDPYHFTCSNASWSNAPRFAPHIPLSQSTQPHRGPHCWVPLPPPCSPLAPLSALQRVLSLSLMSPAVICLSETPRHAVLQPCGAGPTTKDYRVSVSESDWSVKRRVSQAKVVGSRFMICV